MRGKARYSLLAGYIGLFIVSVIVIRNNIPYTGSLMIWEYGVLWVSLILTPVVLVINNWP